MASLTTISKETFIERLENAQTPVVVDFSLPRCLPCARMEDVLMKIMDIYGGRLEFHRIDITRERALARRHGIMTTPSILIFVNGVEKARISGLQSIETVKTVLDNTLEVHV